MHEHEHDCCCGHEHEHHHEEGEEKLHLLMLDNHIPAGAKMYEVQKQNRLSSFGAQTVFD